MTPSDLKLLRSTVCEVLAMAVMDLFPGAELGDPQISDTQFSYEFYLPQGQHPELLPLVEEKMRAILKGDLQVECIEMSQKSAAAFFEHHEQLHKVQKVEDSEFEVLPLVRMGSFCDLINFQLATSPLPPLFFQLLETSSFTRDDLSWIEIKGTAFTTKEELKEFIKKRKAWLKSKPWEEAEKMGFIAPLEGNPVLLPKGVAAFHRLQAYWQKQIRAAGIAEVVGGRPDAYPAIFQQLKKGFGEWGAIKEEAFGPADACVIFSNEHHLLHPCISSLQFIQQTFNMLELNANWVLCIKNSGHIQSKQWKMETEILIKALKGAGFSYSIDPDSCKMAHPSLELRISDSLGEEWSGPFLSVSLNGQEASVVFSVLGPIKRLIVLLAEHKKIKQFEMDALS